MLQPVRGTHDFLPEKMRHYTHILDLARTVLSRYGYAEMSTPIVEFASVFNHVGETSDIVTKETYTFPDRGGDMLTLRPEGTAAVMRAVMSNGLTQSLPLRYHYSGPMFRYDRPQKGRYRQFHQLGVELIGVAGAEADVEVITAADMYLRALSLR
jgi:histidyl-tRNA synthetase